ncbi:MAG: signal peptidase II [Clostridiales bacterium]|nr:signal peptidase II [Clostridiales bacterium]
MSNKFLNFTKKVATSVWTYLKHARVEFIVIILAVAVDLITKGIIQSTMKVGETVVLIPNFLEFYFTYNTAAAFSFDFGLGQAIGQEGVMVVFIVMTFLSLGLFGFIMYKLKNRRLWARICFALIIGGAIGNLYDRMAFSMVRDFIRIVYFGLEIPNLGSSFAVFNIADACLVIGVIMFIVYVIFLETKDKARIKAKNEVKSSSETAEENSENAVDVTSELQSDIDEKSDNVSDISVQNAGENE